MELINISYGGSGYEYQSYSNKDSALITSNNINTVFGKSTDYIEYHVYSETNSLLSSIYDAKKYYPNQINSQTNTFSEIELDPYNDIKDLGYDRGILNIQYNFLSYLFNSNRNSLYWIKEISPSRTELKLSSQTISDAVIFDGFNNFQTLASQKNYYFDFYLNFGINELVLCTNVAFVEEDDGVYLLVKLYEPLPQNFDVKDQFWIVEKISTSVSYNVDIQVPISIQDFGPRLRAPNFKIPVNKKVGQTTPYYNYTGLISSSLQASMNKASSFFQDKALSINVDFTDFSNFIHFSSATSRVNNFVYKLQQIESCSLQIDIQKNISGSNPTTQTSLSSSINLLNKTIDGIINNFDIYEYYLYFNSESFAWPKSTSTQPYSLYSVTSSQAINWLGDVNTLPSGSNISLIYSSSYYDEHNVNYLANTVPQYIREDDSNLPYITFLGMIGQHFDNIWVYYKDVSNKFNATNNPNTGISPDLVADALRGFGFNLYTNTNISDNLYYSLFGINQNGSLLPPTGSEVITTYITSSIDTLSANDLQKEIYKRLYHNLPYLLKTKGTRVGIQALINCYGIPEDILTINEFGGYNRYSQTGIFEINNQKISAITSSLTLSSSLLSPYTTIQYYESNNRLNTTNLEVGFSPSDQINRNISQSQGYINIDQLIGGYGNSYSASYNLLDSASRAYFSTYTNSHSLYEYIRTIKYYNNSLFKTIKDFVPARGNLSTGIIIKPHVLERSKYQRHDPDFDLQLDASQSIKMIEISASHGDSVQASTDRSGWHVSQLGYIPFTSSNGVEKYTGELQGTTLNMYRDSGSFDQSDVSSNASGSGLVKVNYGALYQNVSSSIRSKRFFDLDFTSNQNFPVNFNLITQSISNSQVNNYQTYNDPVAPYSYVQDYNYYTNAWTVPRYYGSKTDSLLYTYYTSGTLNSYDGDASYGKTAAIDKIKYQYAYLVDIYSSSIFFPGRSNAQIKYIIDNNQNVLDLTKTNENIFTVQNIFKSQETCDVSLFEYNEKNSYTQQLLNNTNLPIYEGGYRYLPILHNLNGLQNITQSFSLINPINITVQSAGGGTLLPTDPQLQIGNWYYLLKSNEAQIYGNNSVYSISYDIFYTGGPLTAPIEITMEVGYNTNGTCTGQVRRVSLIINPGLTSGNMPIANIGPITATGNGNGYSYGAYSTHWPPNIFDCGEYIFSINEYVPGGGGNPGNSYTYATNEVSSSIPCLYYLSQSNQVVFDNTIAYYYSNGITMNSESDPGWPNSGLETAIIPFTIGIGDKISFYNSQSLGWEEASEYTIKSTTFISRSFTTSSRLLAELDRPLNLVLLSSGSTVPIDPITGADRKACRYVVWKHLEDETNVILRYNPKDSTLVENGILFPEYIDSTVRQNAGNTIKALKAQNLI